MRAAGVIEERLLAIEMEIGDESSMRLGLDRVRRETFDQALAAFRRANPTAYYCHVVEIELTSDRVVGPAETVKFDRRAASRSHSLS